MNIAARFAAGGPLACERTVRLGTQTARLEIFDDFGAAQPIWRQIEAQVPLATPYQRFEWLANWFAHVGRRNGSDPLIVAGLQRDGEAQFILPLISERRHGCRIARFCGGNHSNLNMAIWRSDAALSLAGPHIAALLAEVATARRIDLFALIGQPSVWCGVPNPFAALGSQPSRDDVYVGAIEVARQTKPRLPSRMRNKDRRLIRLAGFKFVRAENPHEVDRLLAAFWPQRAARFASQGIPNVFADPGVADFVRAACLDGLAQRRPAIELYALEGAGEILAVVGGAGNHHRFSVMFNSITTGVHARLSPGILLIADVMADCASRGMTSFDLGAGLELYKSYFCSGCERRFDCFVPFSARGRVLAAACQGSNAVIRSVKNAPTLMRAFHAVRRLTLRHAARRTLKPRRGDHPGPLHPPPP